MYSSAFCSVNLTQFKISQSLAGRSILLLKKSENMTNVVALSNLRFSSNTFLLKCYLINI
jgi:hypothetical protein